MYLIEESLKNLSGRNFKLFLKRASKNNITSVAGGALITGILQSSSMVSLMVLAFVGANVFTLENALAIILGANLGTTLDSWIVATLGFHLNIEKIAYPILGIGGLLIIIFNKRKNIKYLSYFLLGFGLLFIGLAFMKTAMEEQVKVFDFSRYNDMSLIVFVLIGFLITLTVQSSSVTMALTLSAIHVGAITFPAAVAVVLGSETGTTIKLVLSAIDGSTTKKRVVLGNLIFNIVLTILAYIFIHPIITLITIQFKIESPLIGLVTFSSLINLISIILFIPFLNQFVKLLNLFFTKNEVNTTAYIHNATLSEPELALDLFKQEVTLFIYKTLVFNSRIFESKRFNFKLNMELNNFNLKKKNVNIEEKYLELKQLQGEIQSFYLKLNPFLNGTNNLELNKLISSVRSAMYSMKSLNDIKSNIDNLKRSSKNIKYNFLVNHKLQSENLYNELNIFISNNKIITYEDLKNKLNYVQDSYTNSLKTFYIEAKTASLEDIDITLILNFNHTLFTSDKAILIAVKDLLLNETEAIQFNEEPIYIT